MGSNIKNGTFFDEDRMNVELDKFEKKIKIKIKNRSLLLQALTHKSANKNFNNEKLEFLGDRVLGLVISKKLLDKYPNEKEGIIDKKFANLVNKKTCAEIAKKLNIKKYLFLGPSHKNLERSTDKILSDCLEAIVGSIFLDGAMSECPTIFFFLILYFFINFLHIFWRLNNCFFLKFV